MNRTPTILAGLALLGVIILFVLHFSNKPNGNSRTGTATSAATPAGGVRVAYVDIDTFEAHYESLKKKRDEFKSQQANMEAELQRSAQQMQADYTAVMRKQQAGTLTESEAQAAERRLSQMQQSLETRRQAMSTQFQDKLESFNKTLHEDMDAFLADYTKDNHFDYIFSYSRTNAQILYADKGLNITDDVIKGMNERASKGEAAVKDTAKSK
jgi:outer membrane protein